MMTRVLTHEWVTGGGLAGSETPLTWAAEGRTMRRAIAADFARVKGVEVTRFVSTTSTTPWLAIHILRTAGKTLIFFVDRPKA